MEKYYKKSNIFIVFILAFMLMFHGSFMVLAGSLESEYEQRLSQFGQWVVEDAWNSEGTTVDYYLEFYPGSGELVFSYRTSENQILDSWYGNYESYGPAGENAGMDEGWVYQYSLESQDGVRSGTFILKSNGENLVLTEDTGDCFWAFSSNSSETLVFEECEILDGDGYIYDPSMGNDDEYADGSLNVHKQMLLDTDSMCGVIYLGYVDGSYGSLSENRAYLEELLFTSGYADDFPFLMDIPDDHIAEVDGGMELYCIYPYDEMASVTVTKHVVDEDTNLLVPTDVLYSSDYGDPILVRCNATEVFWDTEVNIVDSNNYKISWMPRVSMRDGRVEVPEEAPFVYDATRYDENDAVYDDYTYENFYTEDVSYFTVVNCNEWVSLRSEPDVNSFRLTEVPLGSFVLDCGEYVNGFNFVSFAGTYGYIKSDYLAVYSEEDIYESDSYDEGYGDGDVQPASTLPVLMTYEEIQSDGHEVLNYTNGEFSVYATKSYSDADGEILKIGGFRGGEPLWGYVSNYPYLTELDNTTAFMAGTVQDPQVAIFNVEAGLMMVDMFFGDMLWENSAEYLQVGGTPCFHVTEDGNIYCSGYYDDGPTAIAADGHIMWRAQKSNPDIYWAYGIEAETDVVLVQYATGTDIGNDVVAFDINDGTELWHDIQPYY